MRWENLTIENEESAALPGFRDPAVVRTFDAPEALGTRFYEVRARSAINEVPKQSRMPFRFTINPYRGCSHACAYCASGDTQILSAAGRTKPLADLRVGDRIYGTVPQGRYRRYVITEVLAHWRTEKAAYRIGLADGTELIASGDHRFLSDRGWKHVTGAEQGRDRRPFLTLNNKLIGTGGFASPPSDSADYRFGYLSGLIRGDGHLASYRQRRPGRQSSEVHQFRLALADLEALRRAREYLADLEVLTTEFAFGASSVGGRPMSAIRTQARDPVAAIRDFIRWPRTPSDDWCAGFLAGIFDAEGSCGRQAALRISNSDAEIIAWTTYCMRRFGFANVVENPRPNGVRCVRIRGGLRERLRFFHTVDPAITRKRSIEGMALESDAPLAVASIEPLGKRELFDITTGTGDFIANGVVSHNCFARPTHTYLDFNAREDFEREIVVKVNAPELVRAELGRPSWGGDHVALGTNTDPYQWVEGRYRLMEGIWEAMRDHSNPCSVLTKSPLLLRDIELMKEIAARTEFSANLSIPTLDEKAWRATEPHTPHPRKRIEAVAELKRAGIRAGVLIAPLIPGVNDAPDQVAKLVELVDEAGADSIGGIGLHLRGEVREIWFDWLREHRPDLIPRYEELYACGAYLPTSERDRLAALVRPEAPSSVSARRVVPRERSDDAPAGDQREPPRQSPLF
jgi:DNA repair photolyase